MGEQAACTVGDATFGGADPPPAAEHDALSPDLTGFGRDRPHQRYLEFKRRRADAFCQGRLDRESHAAVEQRGRETAMHGPGGIEKMIARLRDDDYASAFCFGDIVTESPRDRVERQ